jgi:hypothetical protein
MEKKLGKNVEAAEFLASFTGLHGLKQGISHPFLNE